jgi:undecaprenyl-diphosphatase
MSVPFRRTRRFRTLIVLFLLGAAGFGVLAVGVQLSEPLLRIDHTVADRLHEHARQSPGLVRFFLALTWLGTFWALFSLSVVTIGAMWWLGQPRLALAWAIVLIGSGLWIDGIKNAFDRDRPEYNRVFTTETSYSFPSGHAAGSTVGYGMLAYCLALRWRTWRRRLGLVVGLGLLVLAIGFSRIYLGVHYLSDVLAGFALGLAWLALCVCAIEAVRARLPKPLAA